MPERAVLAVLREHWPLWDSPERIAQFARLSVETTESALNTLRDEGLAMQDGRRWRASDAPKSDQSTG